MICKRKEIWLVNLDSTIGSEIKKCRPAIIIQNDIGNEYSPITIVAPITSQGIEKIYPTEVRIKNKDLDKFSKAILNQIRAIDKKKLIKKLGIVDSKTMINIETAIKISLDII